MVFDRADQPVRVCIHHVRSGSRHDTTMHGKICNRKILGLFVLYTMLLWSKTGPGMRSQGPAANLFAGGPGLHDVSIDGCAGLSFFIAKRELNSGP